MTIAIIKTINKKQLKDILKNYTHEIALNLDFLNCGNHNKSYAELTLKTIKIKVEYDHDMLFFRKWQLVKNE